MAKPSVSILFISLFLHVCLSLAVSASSQFFPSSTLKSIARPLSKLKHPTVIMLSFDGFRFGYEHKTPTPNIHRLINGGTEAELGLIPVFPSFTFPNHHSMATGLYPAYHGIVNNHFRDPITGVEFTKQTLGEHWWLGEPMWVTVANQGFRAATYMWPGSQSKKGAWDCPKNYCYYYNESVPLEDRLGTLLSYFDLPSEEIPYVMNLYFSDPDNPGHEFGPDHPEVTKAVAHVDEAIGGFIKGLEDRGIFDDVHIILVGDHGMINICEKKFIFLEDLKPWIPIEQSWLDSKYPVMGVKPTIRMSSRAVVAKMNAAFKSGKVQNGEYVKVYLKEDLPERYHYVESDRIQNIVIVADEGYGVQMSRADVIKENCGGVHGYDNELFSMRSIFVGHGPRFAKGRKVPSFLNIHIYNMVMSILNIKGAANNGTAAVANSVLWQADETQ